MKPHELTHFNFADLQGGTTHYRLFGEGPKKLVIMCGLTSSLHVYSDLLACFRPNEYSVLLYDYYGRSHSSSEMCRFTTDEYIKQLEELLCYLHWQKEQISLVAYSWSCGLSCKMRLARSFNINKHVMIAPAFIYGNQTRSIYLSAKVLFSRMLCAPVVKRDTFQNAYHTDNAKSYWNTLSTYVNKKTFRDAICKSIKSDLPNWPSYFASMRDLCDNNISVILGEYDRKAPATSAHQINTTLGVIDLHVIEQTGHLAPYEKAFDCGTLLAFILNA